MKDAVILGHKIKEKRLALNLRMDDVAKEAGITRPTLWAIEKGTGNYSVSSLFKVMSILGLSLTIDSDGSIDTMRNRASRLNTLLDKKINSFLIMCVEQYAHSVNRSSGEVYKEMKNKNVLNSIVEDYEDLHGMSTEYLNDYIGKMLE